MIKIKKHVPRRSSSELFMSVQFLYPEVLQACNRFFNTDFHPRGIILNLENLIKKTSRQKPYSLSATTMQWISVIKIFLCRNADPLLFHHEICILLFSKPFYSLLFVVKMKERKLHHPSILIRCPRSEAGKWKGKKKSNIKYIHTTGNMMITTTTIHTYITLTNSHSSSALRIFSAHPVEEHRFIILFPSIFHSLAVTCFSF